MRIKEENLQIYDRLLATLSALALLIGGFWTLAEFIRTKHKENELLAEKINIEYFQDKKAIYYELCDAESEIAACNTYDEVLVAQKHFRKLYVGKAHIIAKLDTAVNNQKVDFCDLLNQYIEEKPQEKPFTYFQSSCLELSDICKQKLDVNLIYKK
jgi:hypothetical protein